MDDYPMLIKNQQIGDPPSCSSISILINSKNIFVPFAIS